MIRYGEWVWEGLSTETKPGETEGALDGHVYKELDTGESYTRIAGAWQFINLGLSFIKATKSGMVVTDANGDYAVSFVTPFINDQYGVALSVEYTGNVTTAYALNKTANGFAIKTLKKNGKAVGGITVSWLATRNYNP